MKTRKILGTAVLGAALAACAAGSASAAPAGPLDQLPVNDVTSTLDDVSVAGVSPSGVTNGEVPVKDTVGSVVGGVQGATGVGSGLGGKLLG
ncbi:hypothetical protein G5C51_36780 [Streptomyces sp. A7024]|uniref:Secreted protein n=2 Tax=Streptomyces coryli TaxID=1128680 RepID=A0A6G4UDZ6_9ACTN|nr:hypothetical protein [Streptomyces coryli]